MYSLNISPIAFTIGTLDIYWYGVLYAVSLLISWCFASIIVKKINENTICPITLNDLDHFLFIGIIITILSARLGHILFYDLNYYLNYPLEIFMLRNGGLSFHGSLIGLTTYIYFYCKKKNISKIFISDLLSISAPLGLITGRLANFVNQELYGKIWINNKGVIFPLVDSFPRYPTQIFEAITEGLLTFFINIFVLRLLKWKSVGSGIYTTFFFIIYSSSRFIIEFYKDVENIYVLNNFIFTIGQLLCMVMFIFGIFIFNLNKK